MQRKKWKWHPDVPQHFIEFADTMADLDILLESHVNHFMSGAAEGELSCCFAPLGKRTLRIC
jgi:hypothetical protein